ncbi:glycosyltransferase family 4 protein [Litchfieldella xinjiangensis]|uniref:glycosyltransferase family 4 protein n=1 Tax=Litchfieldella xinjiangensis TaxID=1166948 RepID=UPI0005BC34BF|nr:glycosyltransferase family 4 protein [Halomonas xinjiangensis]
MSSQILHICLSSGWGGLEMYPARIVPELRRQGWEPHALALAGSRVADSLREAGVEPLTVASRGRALLQVPRLLRYLREHDIEAIHCHKSSDLRLAALLKSLRPSLALFFTDHMGVTRPKKDVYHRWAYGKLSRLFSISEATRARNLEAFPLPASRIRRLYLGIDPTPYTPSLTAPQRDALREALGIPAASVAIGVPGRLSPGKGQQVWIEALGRMATRHPELAFHGVIVGGLQADQGANVAYVGELQSQVAALGLTQQVSFTGFRRDLPGLFTALDIVCIPSRNEAFGLTVIEAMAAGKAIVGSASGAIPEILDERCGRLADPADPDAWAKAMAELARDTELRERLGSAASRVARERFSLTAHVASLVDEYRQAEA